MAVRGYSQRYSFTVTLLPKLFRSVAEEQFDASSLLLRDVLKDIGRFSLVAELTKNCNIHYHGIIEFRMDWLNHRLVQKVFKDIFRQSKTFGFVDIKVMTNEQGWHDYMKKDMELTYNAVSRFPVVHDDLNVVPTGKFSLYQIELICDSQ